MITKPHAAYSAHSLTDLFNNIRSSAQMYTEDANEGERPYGKHGAVMPALDTLPKAMLYRARVIEQVVDEIKARAYQLQQKEYDSFSISDKVSFHKEEIEMCLRQMEDEVKDSEDFLYWEKVMQYHDSYTYVLGVTGNSGYEFGEEYA